VWPPLRDTGRDRLQMPNDRTGLSAQDLYRDVYLKSDHWLAVRKQALARANGRCQLCNKPARDVHHRTYDRLGAEDPMDLTVLCRRCHDIFHRVMRLPSDAKVPRKRTAGRVKPKSKRRKRKAKAPTPKPLRMSAESIAKRAKSQES
jgi:hypothetical protein